MLSVEKEKVVQLSYTLYAKEDEASEWSFVERTEENSPLTFVFGKGALLDTFEANIFGLETDDPFEFELTPEESYGDYDPELTDLISVEELKEGGFKIKDFSEGDSIPLMDEEGNRLLATILEINPNEISVDFNHYLAAHYLKFVGTIVSVRSATEKEVEMGLALDANGNIL